MCQDLGKVKDQRKEKVIQVINTTLGEGRKVD